MPIIKEVVKFNNQEINLKINLGLQNSFIGYQQEIDNITNATTNKLINPVIDQEVRVFYYDNEGYQSKALNFYFYDFTGNSYISNFTSPQIFTQKELDSQSPCVRNSFFMLEFFDSYDFYKQNKIFTTYWTNIGKLPIYSISSYNLNEFYKWFIPLSFINSQTNNIITGYTKFSFYDGKMGKIHIFYNQDYETDSTSKKMYFKTILNINSRTWKISTPSLTTSFTIKAKEYIGDLFVEKINNSFDKFHNLSPSYPNGNMITYTTTGVTYSTI